MSFLRADVLRTVPGAVSIGGHLLEVDSSAPCRCCADWQLRCGACLTLLSSGRLGSDAVLVEGAESVHAVGGLTAVSWAWGAVPLPERPDDRVQVVFDRGLRLPAVAVGQPLGTTRMWVAAAPGRARKVVALLRGATAQRRVDHHPRSPRGARCDTSSGAQPPAPAWRRAWWRA